MKRIIWILVAIAAIGMFVAQQRKISRLQAAQSSLALQLGDEREEAKRALEAAKPDPALEERAKQERAELIKLRGEVSLLRQEKANWEKKVASDRAAAEAAALAAAEKKQALDAQGMQWVENVLKGPANVKGAESGNLRRKLLNREPLNETEQALLLNMMNSTGDIEKSPEDFAAFQTSFISSLLSWNDDPRASQVQSMITAASKVANERGYDYHAPAENADKWDATQKALNARATGGVQKLLTPQEREIFDKAFLGVLGVDFGMSAKAP